MKKCVNGDILEMPQEEIKELLESITVEMPAEPTQADRIEAQVIYTALMTDTLLMEE